MSRKKRIYILPTKLGMVFIMGAVVMILIGASYQNNMVNLLAFFMLSLIFIGMIQTHNNLRDVELAQVEAEGGFAGGEFVLTTTIGNPSRETRFNIEADFRKLAAKLKYENVLPLNAQSTLKLRASYAAGRRGHYTLREVKLSTTFPLGIFRAWIWLPVEAKYVIYPELKGELPLPQSGAGELESLSHAQGGEDFHGHRKYQSGDSHRHVDWKAFARGRPMLVKEFNGGSPGAAELDWRSLGELDFEAKLSQLAKWVEEARKKKIPFSLSLPGIFIADGQGLQHSVKCLELLAGHEDKA